MVLWIRDRHSVKSCGAVVGPTLIVDRIDVALYDGRSFSVVPGDALHTTDGLDITVRRS